MESGGKPGVDKMAGLAEEVLMKHNKAMFERLDQWLDQLNESLKVPLTASSGRAGLEPSAALPGIVASLSVPVASPCLSSAISPLDFETISDRMLPEAEERPRVPLGRMDSAAEGEARLKAERMSLHFQEIEEADAQKQEAVELDTRVPATCQRWADRCLKTQTAHIFFGLVVVSNSFYLGVQLEFYANTKDYSSLSDVFMSLHIVYAVLFTFEVCLHLAAEGVINYFWCEDWAWNWLDTFVVTSSWIELIIDLLSPGDG